MDSALAKNTQHTVFKKKKKIMIFVMFLKQALFTPYLEQLKSPKDLNERKSFNDMYLLLSTKNEFGQWMLTVFN